MALVFIAADIHHDLKQMCWIEKRAQFYSAIILAGDLINVFSPVPVDKQRMEILGWLDRLAESGSTIAFTDGNHDIGLRSNNRKIIGPLETRRIEGVGHVTCLPWQAHLWPTQEFPGLAAERARSGLPWLVVSHLAPPSSPLGQPSVDRAEHVDAMIENYQPDFVACGHLHDAPYAHGDGKDALGPSIILNPGRAKIEKTEPNHILLDPRSGTIVWKR